MSDGKKLVKGSVYRLFAEYSRGSSAGQRTGDYVDVICDDESGAGTILRCVPTDVKGFTSGDWFVGGKQFIKSSSYIIAKTLDDYNYKPPAIEKEVVVEKEIVVEKEVIVNVNKYEDTLIDHLYNYYCKIKDRVFNNDFV